MFFAETQQTAKLKIFIFKIILGIKLGVGCTPKEIAVCSQTPPEDIDIELLTPINFKTPKKHRSKFSPSAISNCIALKYSMSFSSLSCSKMLFIKDLKKFSYLHINFQKLCVYFSMYLAFQRVLQALLTIFESAFLNQRFSWY